MRTLLLTLLLAGMTPAQAELKPEWELGLGVAAIDFPLYRGAVERRSYLLPAPYVQYRGKFLQVDRDRVRGLLFRSDRVELDVSLNGAVPVSSQDSEARRDMPDLDPTLELGPSLNFHLYYDERRHTNLDLRLPVRAVFAVSTRHFDAPGLAGATDAQPRSAHGGARLEPGPAGLAAVWRPGLITATSTTWRRSTPPPCAPAYSASGGFAGKQLLASLSRRYGDVWMGGFVKWDDLNGAVFADSPLVQRGQSFAAGFMVAWVFAKSDRLVDVSDD